MTEGKGNKVAWGAIMVAIIAGISANVQTWVSTASERADKANENIRILIGSLEKQLKFGDEQIVKLSTQISNLDDRMEGAEGDVGELRQMLFAIALQRNKQNKMVEEKLEDVLAKATSKSAQKRATSKSAKPKSQLNMVQAQRPKWPPELVKAKGD